MALRLKLFNNITDRRLVKGLVDAGAFILPEFSDQDDIAIELQILELSPGGGSQRPFAVVEPSGISASIAIGSMTATYASQTSFTVDGDLLTGNLNLNTPEMVAAVASSPFRVEALFAIVLTDADGQDLTFQGQCVVKKSLIRNGVPATVPGVTYLTTDQAEAIYLRKVGRPGETWTSIDSTNTYGTIHGTNPDGSAQADSFTI